jgi:hypothetical protein
MNNHQKTINLHQIMKLKVRLVGRQAGRQAGRWARQTRIFIWKVF